MKSDFEYFSNLFIEWRSRASINGGSEGDCVASAAAGNSGGTLKAIVLGGYRIHREVNKIMLRKPKSVFLCFDMIIIAEVTGKTVTNVRSNWVILYLVLFFLRRYSRRKRCKSGAYFFLFRERKFCKILAVFQRL
jgi:hypothetical protein